MKYALSLILGVLAGAVTGALLLYVNPFTRHETEPSSGPHWVLEYSLAGDDAWLTTHATRLGLPVVPEGVQLPFESGIKGTIVAAMPLVDVTHSASAAATRISIPSPRTDLLAAGVVVEDHWLISVPGQGSVLVHSVNNQWPLLRDTLVRVNWLRRDWGGPGEYMPTQGPEAAGAEVIGLTGQYAGTHGTARERLTIDDYDGADLRLAGALLLDVPSE
jgi:hypothetical protein